MSRAINHASKFDPLLNAAPLSQVKPYYEDRILVRWTPPPAGEPGMVTLASRPSQRDTGPQYGVVVAVGPGASGRSILKKRSNGDPYIQHKPFKGGSRFDCICKPGDTILYQREPGQEFEDGGVLHTFLYEEQRVLAVIEDVGLKVNMQTGEVAAMTFEEHIESKKRAVIE